jgi:hypothetical protein
MATDTTSIIPQGGSYAYAYGFVSARIHALKLFSDMPVGTTADHYEELISEINKLDAIISQIKEEMYPYG